MPLHDLLKIKVELFIGDQAMTKVPVIANFEKPLNHY
jgi:hypothetical protein